VGTTRLRTSPARAVVRPAAGPGDRCYRRPVPGQTLPVVGDLHLDSAASDRLWNWLLSRQGLAESARMDSVISVSDASLGLHAARLPSPFATLAARSGTSAVPMRILRQDGWRDLVTVRCMRKTLHALPPKLAAAAHAATMHFRERDALRAVTNAGLTFAGVDHVADLLVALLDDHGRLGYRDITLALAAEGIDRTTARLAVKVAWERGQIVYANDTDRWDREVRTFGLPDGDVLGGTTSRDEATAVLMAAYIDRYGPVSLRDATWWSGLSRAAVTAALRAANTELVHVTTSWSDQPQFMCRVQAERFLRTDGDMPLTGISLLAHEDVALKAYQQTRQRYLGPLRADLIFNQIGEALPAILQDGRVIGRWKWDRRRMAVVCRFARGLTSSVVRAEVRARATHLGAVLGEGLAGAPKVSVLQLPRVRD
jgi:hypothetical protein